MVASLVTLLQYSMYESTEQMSQYFDNKKL